MQPDHHEVVRESLLDGLRRYGGSNWSPEYEQAWRDGYDAIAVHMIAGAAAAGDRPAYWPAEVLGHDRRTNDIAVVSCRTLERLSYRAGQYVTLETPYRPPLWRTYSIADAG